MKNRTGRRNILDIIIIAVIIIAVFSASYLIYKKTNISKDNKPVKEITFDVLVTNIDKSVAENCKVGDIVVFGNKNNDTGKIIATKVEPYKVIAEDKENGVYKAVDHPSKYQVTITIQTDSFGTTGIDDPKTGIPVSLLAQMEEIRIGAGMTIHGKQVALSGFIIGVDER